MRIPSVRLRILTMALASLFSTMAAAKLPAPTPEQQQAAAAKKQQAAEQAEREKQELAASMDKVASRWRSRANSNGWETYSPVSVSAPQGFNASANQSSGSGQPGGQLGADAAKAPVRSEKAGTAPPSQEVKNPAEKGK